MFYIYQFDVCVHKQLMQPHDPRVAAVPSLASVASHGNIMVHSFHTESWRSSFLTVGFLSWFPLFHVTESTASRIFVQGASAPPFPPPASPFLSSLTTGLGHFPTGRQELHEKEEEIQADHLPRRKRALFTEAKASKSIRSDSCQNGARLGGATTSIWSDWRTRGCEQSRARGQDRPFLKLSCNL